MSRHLGSKYVLDERLGRGGFGEVWRAHDLDGNALAIKILHPSFGDDPKLVERFVQERNLLLSLEHPNLVRVRGMLIEDETFAFAMDLIDGGDLRSHLRARGRLPEAEALAIAQSIAGALDYIHQRGIVHRDVKPENILLSRHHAGLVPMLTDFGIARLESTDSKSTAFTGTPVYVAPELFDDASPTPASDAYSLGIVLYELLAGYPPFRADSFVALMRMHLESVPARPDGVSDRAWDLVSALLAKDPAERPSANLAETLASGRFDRPPVERTVTRPPPAYGSGTHLDQTRLRSRVDETAARLEQAAGAIGPGVVGWPAVSATGPVTIGRRISGYFLDGAIGICFSIPLIVGYALVVAAVVSADPGQRTLGVVLVMGSIVLQFAYALYQWRLFATRGATTGRRLAGYTLVNADTGQPPGWGPPFVYYLLVALVGTLTLGSGLVVTAVIAAAAPDRRSWIDKAANLRAVSTQPSTKHVGRGVAAGILVGVVSVASSVAPFLILGGAIFAGVEDDPYLSTSDEHASGLEEPDFSDESVADESTSEPPADETPAPTSEAPEKDAAPAEDAEPVERLIRFNPGLGESDYDEMPVASSDEVDDEYAELPKDLREAIKDEIRLWEEYGPAEGMDCSDEINATVNVFNTAGVAQWYEYCDDGSVFWARIDGTWTEIGESSAEPDWVPSCDFGENVPGNPFSGEEVFRLLGYADWYSGCHDDYPDDFTGREAGEPPDG